MGNELYLLIAAFFLINGVLSRIGMTDQEVGTPLYRAPYLVWFYVIDCLLIDVFLVLYALTQWGGL